MKSYLLGAALGFIVGVLGNLVASWIQADILQNSFTFPRILIIFLLTIFGILVATALEKNKHNTPTVERNRSNSNGNRLSRLGLFRSRIGVQGKGNVVEDVKSFGSEIDINSEK